MENEQLISKFVFNAGTRRNSCKPFRKKLRKFHIIQRFQEGLLQRNIQQRNTFVKTKKSENFWEINLSILKIRNGGRIFSRGD